MEERPRAFGLVQKAATAGLERLRTLAHARQFGLSEFGLVLTSRQFVYVNALLLDANVGRRNQPTQLMERSASDAELETHEDTTCAGLR